MSRKNTRLSPAGTAWSWSSFISIRETDEAPTPSTPAMCAMLYVRPRTSGKPGAGELQSAHRVLPNRVDTQLREDRDDAEQSATYRRRRVDHRLGQALKIQPATLEIVQSLDDDAL